jgi:hypothetical protein
MAKATSSTAWKRVAAFVLFFVVLGTASKLTFVATDDFQVSPNETSVRSSGNETPEHADAALVAMRVAGAFFVLALVAMADTPLLQDARQGFSSTHHIRPPPASAQIL